MLVKGFVVELQLVLGVDDFDSLFDEIQGKDEVVFEREEFKTAKEYFIDDVKPCFAHLQVSFDELLYFIQKVLIEVTDFPQDKAMVDVDLPLLRCLFQIYNLSFLYLLDVVSFLLWVSYNVRYQRLKVWVLQLYLIIQQDLAHPDTCLNVLFLYQLKNLSCSTDFHPLLNHLLSKHLQKFESFIVLDFAKNEPNYSLKDGS